MSGKDKSPEKDSEATPHKPDEDLKSDAAVALVFAGLLVNRDKPGDMAVILQKVLFTETDNPEPKIR